MRVDPGAALKLTKSGDLLGRDGESDPGIRRGAQRRGGGVCGKAWDHHRTGAISADGEGHTSEICGGRVEYRR